MEILSLINKAGSQRVVTQKIMKFIMLQRFDESPSVIIDDEVMECINTVNSTQHLFLNWSGKSGAVADAVYKVQAAWLEFVLAYKMKDTDKLADLNATAVLEMDELVRTLINLNSPQHIANKLYEETFRELDGLDVLGAF
ncbi:MAG: hypothetical protein HRT88_11430 [Lentisphaeraceae bacterium]|nr:hypothetical protein [Lentisphaeraceae bacterium]